jgi:hypothetical protein
MPSVAGFFMRGRMGGMRSRKLRIAWSVACVLVCQPLLILWALSYSELNGLTMHIGRSRGMIVAIDTGRLAIAINDHPFVWRSVRSDLRDVPPGALPESSWAFDADHLTVPMWLPVILAGVLATVPWIRWSTRFNLRRGNNFWQRTMRFPKLRMAFFATSLIAGGFLLAFCLQDYWKVEQTFGRSQVEQFIRDRPGVGDVINRKPALRTMLESSFEGDEKSGRIHWDCNQPVGPAPAEHSLSHPGRPAFVRVSKSADISAVDKCSMLVYELINFSFDDAYKAYDSLAWKKQISRDDYARSCIRIELTVSQKTKEYFQNNPIADENDRNNHDYVSTLHDSNDLTEFMQWMQSESYKPYDLFEYYRGSYDKIRFDDTR